MKNEEGRLQFEAGIDTKELNRDVNHIKAKFEAISNKANEEGKKAQSVFNNLIKGSVAFFGVREALGFAKHIALVRGEFQQLNVAFKTMLGNKEKADALMSKVVNFAAITPFTLQEVASGAKQLLAYRIEANKIIPTLKAIGDVSAGLNVPIERLILNYGQIKTQTKLSGRDLRDFNMAGVPLIAELSKNLNKSQTDIQSMVSAGRIGFKDVEHAFITMTSAGGAFNNLMEKQSKTITGRISNLQDALDKMFNAVGKSNQGIINDTISGASYLVKHYKEVGDIIKELIITYGVYKASIITGSAVQKSVEATKLREEAKELDKLLTLEQKRAIGLKNSQNLDSKEIENIKRKLQLEQEKQKTVVANARKQVVAEKQSLQTSRIAYQEQKKKVALIKREIESTKKMNEIKKTYTLQTKLKKPSEDARKQVLSQKQSLQTSRIAYQEQKKKVALIKREIAIATKQNEVKKASTLQTKLNTASQKRNALVHTIKTKKIALATAQQKAQSLAVESNTLQTKLNTTANKKNTLAQDVKAKKISTLQTKLNTASQKRNTLVQDVKAKKMALATAQQKAQSLAVESNTLQTNINTASKKASVRASSLFALGMSKIKLGLQGLKKTILANPYGILIFAVSTLVPLFYRWATSMSEAEKAQKRLDDAVKESQVNIYAERSEIDLLFTKLRLAKKGTEEYKTAKDTIFNKYGQYLKKLGDESTALNDVALAYKTITKEAEKAARARAMDSYIKKEAETRAKNLGDIREAIEKELKTKLKGKKDKDGNILARKYSNKLLPVIEGNEKMDYRWLNKIIKNNNLENSGLHSFLLNQINMAKKYNYIFKKVVDTANIRFGDASSRNLSVLDNRIKKLKKKIKDLNEKKPKEKKPKEKKSNDKERLKDLADLNKALKKTEALRDSILHPKDPKEDAVIRFDKEKAIKDLKKIEKELKKLKSFKKVDTKQVDNLEAQEKELKKKIKSYTNAHKTITKNKKIQQEKEYQDRKTQLEITAQQNKILLMKEGAEKELAQLTFDNNNKLNAITKAKEKEIAKLKKEKAPQKKITVISNVYDEISESQKKINKQSEKAFFAKNLEKYKTYLQKRTDIYKKYAADKSLLENKDGSLKEGVTKGNIDELDSQQQEALKKVDDTFAEKQAVYKKWLEHIANMTLKELKNTLTLAKKALQKAKNSGNTKQIAIASKEVDDLQNKIKQDSPDKKNISDWTQLSQVLLEAQNRFDKLGKQIGGTIGEVIHGAGTVLTSTISIINSIQTLSKASTSEIKKTSEAAAIAIKTAEKASVILLIIQAAIEAVTVIISIFKKSDYAEKFNQDLKKTNYELELLKRNRELDNKGIFGSDFWQAVRYQIDKTRQAFKAFVKDKDNFIRKRNKMISFQEFFFGAPTHKFKTIEEAIKNISVLTKKPNTIQRWFGGHSVYKNLGNLVPNLFGKGGKLDYKGLDKFVGSETFKKLENTDKDLIKKLNDSKKIYDKWTNDLKQSLTSVFGGLGDSLSDTLVHSFESGTGAAKAFSENVGKMLEDLAKKMIYSATLSPLVKESEKKFLEITKSNKSDNQKFREYSQILGNLTKQAKNKQSLANKLLEQYKETAKTQGINILEKIKKDELIKASSKGFAQMGQDTANELNGRFTAIQLHTSQITNTLKEVQRNNATQLRHLAGIETNTARLKTIEKGINTTNTRLDDIIEKGIKIKR